jgi:2-polyprenyl-3-methyl-5-hydroxy-6-metoxy-1,4-benzoquinol methylase
MANAKPEKLKNKNGPGTIGKKRLFPSFSCRSRDDEWMDLPSTSREEFVQALHDIRWVNKRLGGTAALLNGVLELLPRTYAGTFKILDLGTGSADIPLALARWARSQKHKTNIRFEITALDMHPIAVETARHMTQDYPEIEVTQGNALQLSYDNQSFDIVTSSMCMHHLSDADAGRLLREMARLGRLGFVINELERHPLAWLGIHLLGRFTRKGAVFKHDAPLSVLRGFNRKELETLRTQSSLAGLQIFHRRPYRWLLIWRHEAAS